MWWWCIRCLGLGNFQTVNITLQRIVEWPELFTLFDNSLVARFPGLEARGIPCPPRFSCPLNISFQPPAIIEKGGICGVDFSPVRGIDGKKARIFLMPELYHPGPERKPAAEGHRGIVVSSTGIVFDLVGGCIGCITLYPQIGMSYEVNRNTTSTRSKTVIIDAMHSHSVTYFHTLHELFPRLFIIMDYIRGTYDVTPQKMLFMVKSSFPTLNSMNEMMQWGFTPTVKVKGKGYLGSFNNQKSHQFVEGNQHIIVGSKVGAEPWYGFLKSAKLCAFKALMKYREPPTAKQVTSITLIRIHTYITITHALFCTYKCSLSVQSDKSPTTVYPFGDERRRKRAYSPKPLSVARLLSTIFRHTNRCSRAKIWLQRR